MSEPVFFNLEIFTHDKPRLFKFWKFKTIIQIIQTKSLNINTGTF